MPLLGVTVIAAAALGADEDPLGIAFPRAPVMNDSVRNATVTTIVSRFIYASSALALQQL